MQDEAAEAPHSISGFITKDSFAIWANDFVPLGLFPFVGDTPGLKALRFLLGLIVFDVMKQENFSKRFHLATPGPFY